MRILPVIRWAPVLLALGLSHAACRRPTTSATADRGESAAAGVEAAAFADASAPGDGGGDGRAATADGPAGDPGEAVAGCPAGTAPIEGMPACIDRWEAAIEDGRASARPGRRPAERTSWREADAACRAAGRRLCTLAEWEAACAGAAGRKFPYGDDFVAGRCHDATFAGSAARPAGSLSGCVTPEGVFDLSGNVWEWTADTVQEGEVHELRGGGWGNDEALLRCRPEERLLQPPDEPHTAYGFRCCVDRPIP